MRPRSSIRLLLTCTSAPARIARGLVRLTLEGILGKILDKILGG